MVMALGEKWEEEQKKPPPRPALSCTVGVRRAERSYARFRPRRHNAGESQNRA
jgi:hypothetical protein